MMSATTDYQQGWYDGMSKARELIATVKDRVDGSSQCAAAVYTNLDYVTALIDAGLNPPPAI